MSKYHHFYILFFLITSPFSFCWGDGVVDDENLAKTSDELVATPTATVTTTTTTTTTTASILENIQSIQKHTLSPGQSILLEYELPKELQNITKDKLNINCDNKIIPFYIIKNKILKFYLAESYFSTLQPYQCLIVINKDNKNNYVPIVDINISKIEYPTEYLNVNPKKLYLSKKYLNRVTVEKEKLSKIYNISNSEPYFTNKFEFPLNSNYTSKYGLKRIFNKKKNSFHLGLDFRASMKTPIPVSNNGRVVLVRDLFFSGKTIIVDHGVGIFTMYAHLSSYKVKEGMFVKAKQIIGLSGKSGRVSGPHLHWGVRIHNNWIDGRTIIESATSAR
ncbi:MAG: M23 family metallopeptidase [Oligoflexia bacterium]|nr:M23 family metallopeptidase [Oligoflexia bacterium]